MGYPGRSPISRVWWSPDPRALIEFDRFHVSRRLRRTCRSAKFEITRDVDFAGVIRGCAMAPSRLNQTWLTSEMIDAYIRLHKLGYAHSVEVWYQQELAAGVYGVAIGGLFAAESKFYRVRDASKVALVRLVEHLRSRGYTLLDIQQLTPHTARLGAAAIPRVEYLARLAVAIELRMSSRDRWFALMLVYAERKRPPPSASPMTMIARTTHEKRLRCHQTSSRRRQTAPPRPRRPRRYRR